MQQVDVMEKLGGSLIQHGKLNDRIYLMKLARDEAGGLVDRLGELARQREYTKVFAKVPAACREPFDRAGYVVEASVPGLFDGSEEALFMSLFLDESRRMSGDAEHNEQVLAAALDKADQPVPEVLADESVRHRLCCADDAEDMAALYSSVFDSYPFPIDDPQFIRRTMITHVVYFGLWAGERLVALSSAETDRASASVEMTDFATREEFRGRGLASALLGRMDEAMGGQMKTAYTIARAASFGMNITFARRGYAYGGRLIRNTQIAGRQEDMNIWHKPLAAVAAETDT